MKERCAVEETSCIAHFSYMYLYFLPDDSQTIQTCPREIMVKNVQGSGVVFCCIVLCIYFCRVCVVSSSVVPCRLLLCCVFYLSCCVVSSSVVSCHILLCCAVLCFSVLYCVVLCCVFCFVVYVLCRLVLCRAVPDFVVLCILFRRVLLCRALFCVVLCRAVFCFCFVSCRVVLGRVELCGLDYCDYVSSIKV